MKLNKNTHKDSYGTTIHYINEIGRIYGFYDSYNKYGLELWRANFIDNKQHGFKATGDKYNKICTFEMIDNNVEFGISIEFNYKK